PGAGDRPRHRRAGRRLDGPARAVAPRRRRLRGGPVRDRPRPGSAAGLRRGAAQARRRTEGLPAGAGRFPGPARRPPGLPLLEAGRGGGAVLARDRRGLRRPAAARRRGRGPLTRHPMSEPIPLAAYVLLFTVVGVLFVFVHLMIGKVIRPNRPDPEKKTIYEC